MGAVPGGGALHHLLGGENGNGNRREFALCGACGGRTGRRGDSGHSGARRSIAAAIEGAGRSRLARGLWRRYSVLATLMPEAIEAGLSRAMVRIPAARLREGLGAALACANGGVGATNDADPMRRFTSPWGFRSRPSDRSRHGRIRVAGAFCRGGGGARGQVWSTMLGMCAQMTGLKLPHDHTARYRRVASLRYSRRTSYKGYK